MTAALIGQILGISFACGLNLYAAVAALGILARMGVVRDLPTGLQGLQGLIVISSALALFVVEAVVDKVRHADSVWDTVHTFIRPPAAALLTLGALWAAPLPLRIAGASLALLVTLAVHGTKAGLRLALNAQGPATGSASSHAWISVLEDVAAIAFAITAFRYPDQALLAAGGVLVLVVIVGPRFWRAFLLGVRCLFAWFRALFAAPGWRELPDLPGDVRRLIPTPPLGAAPPRGARAGLHGVRRVGAYRNGWLVLTPEGPVFVYRTLLGSRRTPLPPLHDPEAAPGLWADVVRVAGNDQPAYTLFLLKDGPGLDLALAELEHSAP